MRWFLIVKQDFALFRALQQFRQPLSIWFATSHTNNLYSGLSIWLTTNCLMHVLKEYLGP